MLGKSKVKKTRTTRRRNIRDLVKLKVKPLVRKRTVFTAVTLAVFIFVTVYHFGSLGNLYQVLANPSARLVEVQEGWRKEQIADAVGKELGWTDQDKADFMNAHLAFGTDDLEGYYYPKTYVFHRDENPIEVSKKMIEQFQKESHKLFDPKESDILNQDTIMKIASIIQREAAGKRDMNLISGIIWNRMFLGMKLQMDATLQYAKGSEEDGWWPRVYSDDKYIDSPYNTYLHQSLPPTPIANPGPAAIKAAINPSKTNCLYYLHDRRGRIHCTTNYDDHLKNIESYL